MGWLWSSSSHPSSPSSSDPPISQPPASSNLAETQTPHEDPEVQTFLALLSESSSSSQPPSPTSNATTNSTSISTSTSSTWLSKPQPEPVPPLSPLSESLLPTEISCRQAFDLAWSCNSLAGQWNAVYRHGTMRSCSPHWDAFWFCMRTKSFPTKLREDAVREHYRRIEREKYYAPGKRSSEDIWEARTGRIAEGTAFSEPIELPREGDEQWRRGEERRRGIRKDLGFES